MALDLTGLYILSSPGLYIEAPFQVSTSFFLNILHLQWMGGNAFGGCQQAYT